MPDEVENRRDSIFYLYSKGDVCRCAWGREEGLDEDIKLQGHEARSLGGSRTAAEKCQRSKDKDIQ
jgi:hypothetical protein